MIPPLFVQEKCIHTTPKEKGKRRGDYDYKAFLILRRIYFFIEVLPKKYCTIEILYYLCSR